MSSRARHTTQSHPARGHPRQSAILVLVLSVLSVSLSPSQLIRFYQEEVRIRIYGDSCIVTGTYHFRNLTGTRIAQNLLYPFPVSTELPEPTTVTIVRHPARISVPWWKAPHGVVFTVPLEGHKSAIYEVQYVQKTPAGMMTYILTSTKSWGRTFDEATYSIEIPRGFAIESISIPPDTSWTTERVTVFRTKRRSFMPDRDLVIRWSTGDQR